MLDHPVSRDTALHNQRDVLQLTGSTHCTSIPFIIYIDKEDKTYLCTYLPKFQNHTQSFTHTKPLMCRRV